LTPLNVIEYCTSENRRAAVLGPSSGHAEFLKRDLRREYEFTATNLQKQVLITTILRTSTIAMEKKGDYGGPERVFPPST
jgi:hypothetical protein